MDACGAKMSSNKAAWPRNGFEPLFDYAADFVHLNINLGSHQACKFYHDAWVKRYSAAMASWTELDTAIWGMRCRQSLKLAFSATFFALSADAVAKSKIKAAEFYLAYYAMLHAMWAVLYLHPDQNLANVTSITHSKMANLYHSEFASGRSRVIVEDVKALAEDLRFLREYYSYRMPLNSPFETMPELSVSYSRLGGFVKQSIQLANLQSHIIRKVGERAGRTSASVSAADRYAFEDAFLAMNGKRHESRDLNLLDDADCEARSEALNRGVDLMPLSMEYEHMFDNFMTWESASPDQEMLQKVRSLVYNALL